MEHILILAGGRGSRMNQKIPKVLTEIGGEPMIFRLLNNIKSICDIPTLVVGFGSENIMKKVGESVGYVFQSRQLGTGHAVLCAKEKLERENFENIVVLPGDHPLISTKTIQDMVSSHNNSGAVVTVSFVRVSDYVGLEKVFYNCGRIIRDNDMNIIDIVEVKDADDEQKEIKEVNVSYYCFKSDWLWKNIDKLKNDNKAGEYYLTDLIRIAVRQNEKLNSYNIENSLEGMGVNTVEQKEIIENILKKQS